MQFLCRVVNEQFCASIRQQNILIIDDVTTSGSTLNEILRTLRILNEDNEITIFSLIGRKDLMVGNVRLFFNSVLNNLWESRKSITFAGVSSCKDDNNAIYKTLSNPLKPQK